MDRSQTGNSGVSLAVSKLFYSVARHYCDSNEKILMVLREVIESLF